MMIDDYFTLDGYFYIGIEYAVGSQSRLIKISLYAKHIKVDSVQINTPTTTTLKRIRELEADAIQRLLEVRVETCENELKRLEKLRR